MRIKRCLLLCLLPALMLFSESGKVISIADGDTCTVLTSSREQIKIRLAGIDTPEKSQAYGTKAKQALSSKIYNKTVRIAGQSKDRYGRVIADIYVGKRWVNLEMVKEGWAWHYKRYSKDSQLAAAETQAKKLKKGLWKDSDPTPPWDYRRGGSSSGSKSSVKKAAAVTGYWLNTSSNKRHNSNCRNYHNTKRGRPCGPYEGSACGLCGG